MTILKRIGSLLLAAVMVLSMLPVQALAVQTTEEAPAVTEAAAEAEAPEAEAPAAEASEAETPDAEAPEAATPQTEAPATEAPATDEPPVETSGTAPTETVACEHTSSSWSANAIGHRGFCDLCGEYAAPRHTWDESGKRCTVCGYQDHVHSIETYDQNAGSLADGTPIEHGGFCSGCNMYVSENHSWGADNVCTVCGLVNSTSTEGRGTIIYVLNGGVNAKYNPVSYVEGEGCVLGAPTREGYTFDGWFTDADFTTPIMEISTEQTGDITVYAKWSSSAHQLAAPTDLEWGFMRASKYGIPAGTALPGCISWKAGDSLQETVDVAVYQEGQADPCFLTSWTLPAKQGEWCSIESFRACDPDSGTYYFTLTVRGDGVNTLDSETVSSGTWTYTKPTEKLPTVTGLSLTGGMVSWMPPETVDPVRGYEMEVYFHQNENDEPYVVMTRSLFGASIGGTSIADDQQREGTGYYSVRVRVLSNDITQIGNSDWSDLTPEVYYESGTVGFPNFDSFAVLQEYIQREFTQMTELKYVGTEPLVISADLTIPLINCHVVATDVEIAEGCTVTNYGGLQSSTITVNGSIVNEGNLYVINRSGRGLIVSPSGSYSGSGCITVANTGVSDPWERVQGLNKNDYEVISREADYWEILYSPAPTYTIDYVLNGGTNSPENPDSYVEGAGCTLADPTREEYTFDGWYTEETFNNRVTAISAEQTGYVTLYAKWSSIHALTSESIRPAVYGHSGYCSHCNQRIEEDHDWAYGDSLGKYCVVCGYRDHYHTLYDFYQRDENEHALVCEVCGPFNYEEHRGMEDGECDVCAYRANSAADKIAVDEVNFPDANFRNYILSQSYGADGWLTGEELADVKGIDVDNKNISSLKGIEFFTALTSLDVSSNQLTSLDVSSNTALTDLNCSYNQLTSLDVSSNTALIRLYCSSNQLTSLDASSNTALTRLRCDSNQLTSLNVGSNSALTNLDCFINQLTSLDVSGNTALTGLDCTSNQLTSLDVSSNTALTELVCNCNKLTSLDVSGNTALTNLSCYGNRLSSLDVSSNTALIELNCYDNQLSSLNVSNNIALTQLYCGSNQLSSLDVSRNTALTGLSCDSNRLSSLDVSNNTALTSLSCDSNQLSSLDVSNDTALTFLACSSNQLSSLDVSNNTALTQLYCSSNQLTSMDISSNDNITYFNCSSNTYTITTDAQGKFDLRSLPGKFDISRASNWNGGTVDGTILTPQSETVTYSYKASDRETVEFTLSVDLSSSAHQLAAPTDLEWGFMRVSKYGIPAGTAVPGCISWKAGDSFQETVDLAVYREGQAEPRFKTRWTLSAKQGEWCSVQSFCENVLNSGTYYFTLTAVGDGVSTLDSETVSSGTWVYTKPTAKLPTVTDLSLTEGMVSWTPLEAEDLNSIRGYQMTVCYRADKTEESYGVGGRTMYAPLLSSLSIADYQEQWGTGYYSAEVKVLSTDITQIGNSDWSGMTQEVYYDSTAVNFPNFDSFAVLQEYVQREFTRMTELKYVGTEPLVISADLTIPSPNCHVVATDVEIAEGCTVTNYGGLQSSTITVDGSIVNEGNLYVINRSGNGLIVNPSGSYSGNGWITVANTGVSDPWERIQGLNRDDFETVTRQEDYWEIHLKEGPTHAIYYVLNGGTNSPENPDSYVEGVGCNLADPTREEYTFDGWYTEETFTNRVTAISAEQTGDVVLYAKWRSPHTLDPESTRMWYSYHRGYCSHCDQWIEEEHTWANGDSLGTYCAVCGYRDHWHILYDFYQRDENEHALVCEVCGPFNYEEHWGMEDGECDVCGYRDTPAKTCTVTYTWSGNVPPEGDGYNPTGNCPTIPQDDTLYAVGETVSLQTPYQGFENGAILSKYNPENPQKPIMWYFEGWYVDTDKDGQVDEEKDIYVGPTAVMEEGGLHLVGKWSRYHWVTAAWDAGTPEGITTNDMDYPLPYTSEFPCPAGATLWPAYSGLTSYTDEEGKVFHFDGIYMGDEKIGAETIMPDHDVELKLRWTAAEEQEIRHTITYVLNGGVNAPDAPTYYVEGKTCKLVDPARGGDTFMGWYVNTAEFKGEPITEIPADITVDITLYAKWEVMSCDVTYELNGSDAAPVYNDPANPATLTPSAKSVKLKKPTRAGYKFDGWFVDGEPVTEIAFDGRSELTVEAWWTAIDYKLTYKNVAKDEYNPNPTTFTIEGLTLEPLEREGFTFEGWFPNSKCKEEEEITEISAGTAKNTTVYAKWTVHTYTVHFDRNAPEGVEITGKDMKDLTVACGKTVKLTGCAFKDPSKQYVFAGWNTIPNGSGEGFVDKQAIENLLLEDGGEITLYAQWAENDGSYAISFTANAYDYEGEDPDPMTGYYTKSVKLPRSPYTLAGYTFTGWNTASDGSGVTYKAGASVKGICADDSGEVTLYAQWKPITYKISYSLNGGGKVPTNPTTYTMDTLANGPIFLDAPEKKGYTFLGWSTTSKGTPDPDYCIEEKPTGKTTTLKLYAQWRPNEYTIWLAGNGADNSMEPITVQYGKTAKLTNSLVRKGFRFLGWNTMPDGSGKAYKDKASVKNLTLVDGDTVVLYAQWASESYTIRFSANGGSGTMEPMEGVKYGKSQRLTANEFEPSRDGYTFLGWNTKPDGSGKAYKDKASVKNLAPYDSVTVILYAQWVKDEYTVVFDANGGEDENGKRIASQSGLPYKKSTKLDDNPFQRDGYTFLGWNTKADGTGKTYKNKASVKSLCATGDGVVTLYAQWKLVTYKISYSLGGGKNPAGAPKTYNVNSGVVKLPTPTRKGYDFAGWHEIEGNEIPAGSTGNRKLTAVWIKNS